MIIYFAGMENDSHLEKAIVAKAKNILISYYPISKNELLGIQKIKKLKSLGFNIFLDSGAFSAMTLGKEINLEKYTRFILKNKNLLSAYAGLDVIKDWKQTIKNQEYMEKLKLSPLWTFHAGSKEPYSLLKDMSERYNYIALGGTAGGRLSQKYIKQHFSKCFSIIKNKCKVHAFGIGSPNILSQYPFYSADSTTWLMGEKRAVVLHFKNGRMKQYFAKDNEIAILNDIRLVTKYRTRSERNIIETIKMQSYLTALWTKRGVTWDE